MAAVKVATTLNKHTRADPENPLGSLEHFLCDQLAVDPETEIILKKMSKKMITGGNMGASFCLPTETPALSCHPVLSPYLIILPFVTP
jgi:hypothetical protein